MKKLMSALLLAAFVSLGSYSTADATPAGLRVYPPQVYHEPLDGVFPAVGASEAAVYYLDTSSCYASTDGNVAKLSAITYATFGMKRSQYTFVFETYKKNNKRHIKLDRVMDAYGNNVDFEVSDQSEFLKYLFWQIADYSGMRSSLD